VLLQEGGEKLPEGGNEKLPEDTPTGKLTMLVLIKYFSLLVVWINNPFLL
jgi:hypothetical protein